jgi:uncharacterized protein Smg (DUF494 family)
MDKILIALNMIIDFIDQKDNVGEKEVADFLYATGFDDYEVRQTLSVFGFEHNKSQLNIRYFTKNERNRLTDSCVHYLQKLHISGFMDTDTLETVIEKIMELDGYKIGINQVKQAVLLVLLEKSAYLFKKSDNKESIN